MTLKVGLSNLNIVKKGFSYWLLGSIFVVVFILSLGLFYKYWKLTGENSFAATVKTIIQKEDAGKIPPKPISNNIPPQSDIQVLDYYNAPGVLAIGKIVEYLFTENPGTGKTELYAVLSTNEDFLPVRIDQITFLYNGPSVFLVINNLSEEDKNEAINILEDAKTDLPRVENSYIDLFSIGSLAQKRMCLDGEPAAGDGWCPFDSEQKSYTSEELLTEVKKYLRADRPSLSKITDFSGFLHLDGNARIILQVNYPININLPTSIND